MGWLEGGSLLLIWISYGAIQSKRADRVRSFAATQRGILAAGLMLASVALLFGGLTTINAAGGFADDTMQLWAWPVIAVLGLAFVHLQTLAVAIIVVSVQRQVTMGRVTTSTTQHERKDES